MADRQRLQIRLPNDLHQWLRDSAFKQRVSMNTLAVNAIKQEKETQEKETQEKKDQ